MSCIELDDEQARQLINAEQVFEAYRAARATLRDRFAGSWRGRPSMAALIFTGHETASGDRSDPDRQKPRRSTRTSSTGGQEPASAA